MRLFSSLGHYLVTTDTTGLQIHQYASADFDLMFDTGRQARFSTETDYQWQGQIKLRIQESDGSPWQLRLKIPGWRQQAAVALNGEAIHDPEIIQGYLVLERHWRAGDYLDLDLSMPPGLIQPNLRVDAIRGCLAIQRGPLIYCLEAQDQAVDVNILDVQIDSNSHLQATWNDDLLGGLMTVEARGYLVDPASGGLIPFYGDRPEGHWTVVISGGPVPDLLGAPDARGHVGDQHEPLLFCENVITPRSSKVSQV